LRQFDERLADKTLLQFWLLGYEFPATLFLITPEKFYVVTTAKKGMLLSSDYGEGASADWSREQPSI
jgi:nucleosome binding factor SPN SPT16 subunit